MPALSHWRCCRCSNFWLWALYVACTNCGHRRCLSCKGVRVGADPKLPQKGGEGLVTSSTNPSSRPGEQKSEHENPYPYLRVQQTMNQSSGRRLSRHAYSANISQPPPTVSSEESSIEDEDESTLEPVREWQRLQTYPVHFRLPPVNLKDFHVAEPAKPNLWSNLRNSAALTLLLSRSLHHHVSQLKLSPSSHEAPRTIFENWKTAIEARLRRPILWWPLSAPEQECGDGETRVAWNCSCGASLSLKLSGTQAQAFGQRVRLFTQSPVQPPLLPTHQSQQPQSSQNVPSTSRNVQPSTSALGQQMPLGSPRIGSNNSLLRSAVLTPAAVQAQSSQKYLHWCVDIGPTEIKLVEFDKKDITDSNLVPSLLERYHALRGLRSWLTLTSCAGVRLIKFSKLFQEGDHVTCLRDELPCRKTNTEYEYQYFDTTMPEKDFIKVVQSIIALRIRKPSCPEIVRLGSALDYVPKKVNGRMQRGDGYGMYAVSAYCVWKAIVVLFIVSTPSVAFMIRWLIGHKGDWQNALTWLMLTFTVFNIAVLQHDRWSMQTLG